MPPAKFSTAGFYNGHWWNQTSPEIKIGYVVGTADSMDQNSTTDFFPWTLTYSEIANRLDTLYSDKSNLNISVRAAIRSLVKPGASADELRAKMDDIRRLSDKIHAQENSKP